MYYHIRQTHPLGCSQREFTALTPWQSECLLVRASKTKKVFQTFREHPQHRISSNGQMGQLAALSFLSERFLFSADNTTKVYVWDISKLGQSASANPHAISFPCVRLTLVTWNVLTYGMSIDHSTLYVVIFRGQIGEEVFTTCVVRCLICGLVLLECSSFAFGVMDWRTGSRSRVKVQSNPPHVSTIPSF